MQKHCFLWNYPHGAIRVIIKSWSGELSYQGTCIFTWTACSWEACILLRILFWDKSVQLYYSFGKVSVLHGSPATVLTNNYSPYSQAPALIYHPLLCTLDLVCLGVLSPLTINRFWEEWLPQAGICVCTPLKNYEIMKIPNDFFLKSGQLEHTQSPFQDFAHPCLSRSTAQQGPSLRTRWSMRWIQNLPYIWAAKLWRKKDQPQSYTHHLPQIYFYFDLTSQTQNLWLKSIAWREHHIHSFLWGAFQSEPFSHFSYVCRFKWWVSFDWSIKISHQSHRSTTISIFPIVLLNLK